MDVDIPNEINVDHLSDDSKESKLKEKECQLSCEIKQEALESENSNSNNLDATMNGSSQNLESRSQDDSHKTELLEYGAEVSKTNKSLIENDSNIVIANTYSIKDESQKTFKESMIDSGDDDISIHSEPLNETSESQQQTTGENNSKPSNGVQIKKKRKYNKGPRCKTKKKPTTNACAQGRSYVRAVYIDLPKHLKWIEEKKASVITVRERLTPDEEKLKVKCVEFHEDALNWTFNDTLLSYIDSSRILRSKLETLDRNVFPSDVNSHHLFPVHADKNFPFVMPSNTNHSQLDSPLPHALEEFTKLCPDSVMPQLKVRGSKRIRFSDEPLEWAFKETLLSSFHDSPIVCDLLELTPESETWPSAAAEILSPEPLDYDIFPYACPNSKKQFESMLLKELDFELPKILLKDSLILPEVPSYIETEIINERENLLRLLALSSHHLHAYDILQLKPSENKSIKVCLMALIASLRPLVVAQANRLAFAIKHGREAVLRDIISEDESIVSYLINGPIYGRGTNLFPSTHRIQYIVNKDRKKKLKLKLSD